MKIDTLEAPPSIASLSADLNDARILITGGTGSFGQAFVRRLVSTCRPRRLVIFSRDEAKQYEMEQRLPVWRYPFLRYFIGDVRSVDRLEMALRDIEFVVHAAALKHVPIAEYNPFECIHTNVLGAENVVRAALRTGVKRVVALSTDKAVSPINLYGASKLAADKIFVAANALGAGSGTIFSVVRYGNVMGSRGSVVPLFRRLISEGVDALPITDPRMTRFWITLDRSIDLVLSALVGMRGGETFVPKIPSVTIVDLARALAPHLPHRVIGIRPGEKLHEVLLTEDDARNTMELPDRYVILSRINRRSDERDEMGVPVAEGFRYASDSNPDRLTGERLADFLAEAGEGMGT